MAIPSELWLPEWYKMGFKTYGDERPLCRLNKALYGHPEAGGHWERHLNDALKVLGATPVKEHKSSYWFAKEKQLLTVYVDDLLMSGPADKQDAVWKQISAKVDVEDPEPLDRYMGRTHVIEPLPKPA